MRRDQHARVKGSRSDGSTSGLRVGTAGMPLKLKKQA